MSLLRVSGPVRRLLGRDADTLTAGIGLPDGARCWQCGEPVDVAGGRPGSVTLSAVTFGAQRCQAALGHTEHTTSRVFTAAAFAQTPGVRRRMLLDLAGQVHTAGSDDEALRIMQDATGLSFTDLGADRAELDARAARRRDADRARAAGARVLTLRCPSCGQLPDLVVNPGQAFCGNDTCEALQYAPDTDAFEQLANRGQIGSLVGPGKIPAEMAAASAARRPVQVRGSGEDDVREAEIREVFHRWGYTCADAGGVCGVCDWPPTPE